MSNAPMVVLPPEPPPRSLTANAPVRTLHDHFLAFLDVNNPQGFNPEVVAQISDNAIGDLMLLVAVNDSLSVRDFKREVTKLKKLTAGAIGHSHCLELMARLFGYRNWNEANHSVKDGRLVNRRADRARISMKIFDIASRK